MEDERKKVYYNHSVAEHLGDKELPEIKQIVLMSMAMSGRFYAYLSNAEK